MICASHEIINNHFNPNQTCMSKSLLIGFIILFDQIPRNIFRGTPRAYENDELVSNLVKEIFNISNLNLLIFTSDEFNFLILPLLHLEDKTLESSNLAYNITVKYWDSYINISKFALIKKNKMIINIQKHKNLLEKFGRYPLRNPILQRESSIAETLYISENKNRMV